MTDSPLGGTSGEFSCIFLFVMHGFRDNEVLLQAGYAVIVISPLGGASGEFCQRILKERL